MLELDLYYSMSIEFLRAFTILCNPVSVYVCSGDEYAVTTVIIVHSFTIITGYKMLMKSSGEEVLFKHFLASVSSRENIVQSLLAKVKKERSRRKHAVYAALAKLNALKNPKVNKRPKSLMASAPV